MVNIKKRSIGILMFVVLLSIPFVFASNFYIKKISKKSPPSPEGRGKPKAFTILNIDTKMLLVCLIGDFFPTGKFLGSLEAPCLKAGVFNLPKIRNVSNTRQSYLFVNGTSGNVDIGTAGLEEKLEAAGNVNIESFEKPQIQNSLRRTLKEIFFENRGYSKSSIINNLISSLAKMYANGTGDLAFIVQLK